MAKEAMVAVFLFSSPHTMVVIRSCDCYLPICMLVILTSWRPIRDLFQRAYHVANCMAYGGPSNVVNIEGSLYTT